MIFKNSNEVILDAYNANPSSMKVAIDNFVQLDKPNKMIFLGDMFEVGADSNEEHRFIVESLSNYVSIDCCFIGNDFYKVQLFHKNFKFFATYEDLKKHLEFVAIADATILIKGSRGMALERILDLI
jgi:UDP-N-acetylmuramoyl-tripeptide--D-alanyl-D-alanine ligase